MGWEFEWNVDCFLIPQWLNFLLVGNKFFIRNISFYFIALGVEGSISKKWHSLPHFPLLQIIYVGLWARINIAMTGFSETSTVGIPKHSKLA